MNKKIAIVLLVVLCMVSIGLAEEVVVPDFSRINTYNDGAMSDEQIYSCIWAASLVRRNVTIKGYLEALDIIGLECLKIDKEETGAGPVTTLWFSSELSLDLYGDPVEEAYIYMNIEDFDKYMLPAQIPIDLDNNYLTTMLGPKE